MPGMDPRERRVQRLSDEIRGLRERATDKTRERRHLMLDLNRERVSTYQRLVELTQTDTSNVAAELARARGESGLRPMPQGTRQAAAKRV